MVRVLRFSLLVVLSIQSVLGQIDSTDLKKSLADKLFREGNALQKVGKYAGAIEKYERALAYAEDFDCYYQLGLSYKRTKQYDRAARSIEHSIKLKPNVAGSHHALGEIYFAQKKYDKAIESYNQALRFDPQLKAALNGIADTYVRRGQELLNGGELSSAGALMDEALQRPSENAAMYLLAARIYNQLERPLKSIEAANLAMKLKKEQPKGAEYFEIGIAHKKMMEYDQARKAFTEARKDPKFSRQSQNELDKLKGK